MNRDSLLTILLLAVALLLGCHFENRVYVLTATSTLSLPFKASQFVGYFDREGLDLRVDEAGTPAELINLLNFSKYSAVICDGQVADKLTSLSKKWKKICLVAVKTGEGEPIKKRNYYLLVKERLLFNTELLIKLVRGWNYGTELLKDPAVVYYLTGKGELRGVKFLKCKGTNED